VLAFCRRRPSFRRVLPGLVLGALSVCAVGCGPERLETVPEPLLGRWVTDAPRYRDRWLEIHSDALLWGVRELELDRQAIETIERLPAKEGETYDLHYTEAEGFPARLRIRWRAGPPARIRLDSREHSWQRAASH